MVKTCRWTRCFNAIKYTSSFSNCIMQLVWIHFSPRISGQNPHQNKWDGDENSACCTDESGPVEFRYLFMQLLLQPLIACLRFFKSFSYWHELPLKQSHLLFWHHLSNQALFVCFEELSVYRKYVTKTIMRTVIFSISYSSRFIER